MYAGHRLVMRLRHSLFLHPALFAGSLSLLGMACGGSSEVRASRSRGAIGVIMGDFAYGWAVYGEAEAPRCGLEELGACMAYEPCPLDEPVPVTSTADAGTVTVQGTPLMLDVLGQSYFGAVETATGPGDIIEMRASGSEEVPAHSGSVIVPELATLLQPLDDVVRIDRSEDLLVSWTPVADGNFGVYVSVPVSPDASASVSCSALASKGHLIVPARALARLPATDAAADRSGFISFWQENQTRLRPRGWEVSLLVNAPVDEADVEIF